MQVTASVEMIFRHIFVIALPRPGLRWGFTLDTYGTLPTRANNPPIFATPNIPLEQSQACPHMPCLGSARRMPDRHSVLGGVCNLSYQPYVGA